MTAISDHYDSLKALNLKLDLTRGQPGDDNLDVSNPMLTIVDERTLVTSSGVSIRNYPGGVTGLREAREQFAPVLGVSPDEMIVGNNSSLAMMGNVLMWALLRGVKESPRPWGRGVTKFIVTVPGYDRHFTMLDTLGIEMIPVKMTGKGPDVARIERIVAADPDVKGMIFVPTYSNPTGDVISDDAVQRLAAMKTAAPDFTIVADDAYVVHHLVEDPPPRPLNLLSACKAAGNPHRVILFGSTSKITFSGAGIGFMGMSQENVAYYSKLIGTQMICPNKIEQYRHVLFIQGFEGGIPALMRAHARLLRPKFDAVQRVLERELGGKGLARWTDPAGGYFVSLDTSLPIADKVVDLAKAAGVALTPAGATYPRGIDPENRNIRLSPSRPPWKEIEKAMEVVAVCVQLAAERARS